MTARTWFITGCATGFGRVMASQALARGDRVAVIDRDRAAVPTWPPDTPKPRWPCNSM